MTKPGEHKIVHVRILKYVVDRLAEFYAPDEIRVWLYSRNDLLDGAVSIVLIDEGKTEGGLQAIEDIAGLNYL